MPPQAFGEEFDFLFFGMGAKEPFTIEGKYAVVDICGPLEQHSSWRLDSYDAIRERVAAAFSSDAPEVCLRICSPGGHFAGCLELTRAVRSMAAAVKKPLKAFVDSQALSAGFALACAADEIVITPSASVGSVGVWSALVDATEQDKARGLKVEIVASDDHKADRNPHAAMTPESIDRLRAEINDMAELFREEVAEGRGMRPSSLRKLKGAAVFGDAAVKAHLADRTVDSWSEFLNDASKAKSGDNQMSLYSKAAMQDAAAKGDDDAKKALAAMAKADDDEEMAKKSKASKDEEEKSAKAGGGSTSEGTKAKAKEDAPIKKDDEKDAKALALESIGLVHKMQADAIAKEALASETEARKALLATRPDFSDDILKLLGARASEGGPFKLSLAEVETAVKTFPKSAFRNPNTAALVASGTAGEGAGGELHLPTEMMALLDRKMPLGGKTPVAFSVGCGDPDAARRFLAAQDAARNGVGK